MRRRLAGVVLLALAALGFGAGFLYLRGSDPVLVDWIAERKADHYCRSALGRIGIALQEWERSRPGEPYPETLEELAGSGIVPGNLDLCCPLSGGSSPSYRLAPGIQSDMPPLAILAYEIGARHPRRNEQGERTGRLDAYCLFGSFQVDPVPGEGLARALARQQEKIQRASRGEIEPLLAELLAENSYVTVRVLDAWALGRVRAEGEGRNRVLAGLCSALALREQKQDLERNRRRHEDDHLFYLEAAYSLDRHGDPRGAGTVFDILALHWADLSYSERVRAVRFARRAWSDPTEPIDLDPLDSSPDEAKRAARLRDRWNETRK